MSREGRRTIEKVRENTVHDNNEYSSDISTAGLRCENYYSFRIGAAGLKNIFNTSLA